VRDKIDKIVKIIDNDEMLLSYIAGTTDKAIIIFTDLFNRREQFVRWALGDHTYIFIADKKDSWGNELNIDIIQLKIKDLVKDKTIMTLGNSMAGSMAISFADCFNASYCLSFVPQYSIKNSVINNDYLACHEQIIKQWKFDHVVFNDHTHYTILTTNGGHDLYHLDLFKEHAKSNVSLLVFEESLGFHHGIVAQLMRMGLLEPVMLEFLDNGKISDGTHQLLQPHLEQ
jgi:hypothetical protein